MSEKHNSNIKHPREIIDIRIAHIFSFLRKYTLLFLICGIAGGIVGYLFSFTLPKTYRAKTILLPEYNMSSSSIFAMAVNTSEGAEKLSPNLYPTILEGIPFGMHLLKQPVTDLRNKSYKTLNDYLSKSPEKTFLSSLFSSRKQINQPSAAIKLDNSEILSLSREEEGNIKRTTSSVYTVVDKKNGIITLECEMNDPVVSAMVVESSKNYLVQFVEEYRTAKLDQQVSFLEQRVKESKIRQQSAEYALQSYRDRNRNAYLNVARIEEQRLQSDYTLAQSIYSDLVSRLEQTKLKVKQEKPVFKVLEPTKIPIQTSGPRHLIIAILTSFAFSLALFLYIFFIKERYYLMLWNLIIINKN